MDELTVRPHPGPPRTREEMERLAEGLDREDPGFATRLAHRSLGEVARPDDLGRSR